MWLTTSCSLKSNMAWIVCCPFFHKSPPNCTFGYNWNLDEFEDWASLWHWANRLKRLVLSAATFTSLSLNSPQVALCGWGVEDLARVPISTSSTSEKCQMPLAHGAGTLTNYHSHCHGKLTRTIETLSTLFRLWIRRLPLLRLGVPPVPPHLISSGTWMEIVAPEIQPVTQLINQE